MTGKFPDDSMSISPTDGHVQVTASLTPLTEEITFPAMFAVPSVVGATGRNRETTDTLVCSKGAYMSPEFSGMSFELDNTKTVKPGVSQQVSSSEDPVRSIQPLALPELKKPAILSDWMPPQRMNTKISEPRSFRPRSPFNPPAISCPKTGLRPIKGNVPIASDSVSGTNIDSEAELCVPGTMEKTLEDQERFDEVILSLNGIYQNEPDFRFSFGYDIFPNATSRASTKSKDTPGEGITPP